jgi:hypothetical protein
MGGGAFAYDIRNVTADTDFTDLGYEQQAVVVEAFAKAMRDRNLARASMCARVLRTANPILLQNGVPAELFGLCSDREDGSRNHGASSP